MTGAAGMLALVWLWSAWAGWAAAADPTSRTCEPIKVEMCKSIGYNLTGMPNFAKHTMQTDAETTMQTFSPLLQYGCASQLLLFLCSVYVPMCTDKVAMPIGPCRGLCESVYARCYPILKGFGFPWPVELNCSQFPAENNHEHMCMDGPEESNPSNLLPSATIPITLNPPFGNPNLACQNYSKSTSYIYLTRSKRCAQYCDAEILYDASDKRLAEVWLYIWAALCFVSTMIAMLTFFVGVGSGSGSNGNSGSFRYPARPLVFMALCHNLSAVGWGVRGAAGHAAVACSYDVQTPTRNILSQDGLANPNCAVVFLLLYYFGMAATVW